MGPEHGAWCCTRSSTATGPSLRGAGRVMLRHIPGETNPADLFTKILTKQPFEKHRKVVLNLPGDTGMEHARRIAATGRSAPPTVAGRGA